jgi:hypothetical protein
MDSKSSIDHCLSFIFFVSIFYLLIFSLFWFSISLL